MQRVRAPIALTAVASLALGCGVVHYRKDAGTDSRADAAAVDGLLDFLVPQDLADIAPVDNRITPDAPLGHWVQAYEEHCPSLCAWLDMVNVPSVEGSRCMSGEVRPPSGIAANIDFYYGCSPPDCPPMAGPLNSTSDEMFCYLPGQPIDDDLTDLTVGCFCR